MISVSKNFLSEKEREDIKQRVYSLKKYYRTLDDSVCNDIDNNFIGTLGNAIYAHSNIKRKINYIMKKNFSDLYDKTIFFLRNFLKTENIKLADFSVPGFHIFRGTEASERSMHLHYHVDISVLDHPAIDSSLIDESNIFSFVSIIENTNDPAYLDYVDGKFFYEYGNLNFWSAFLKHRIGSTCFFKGESRITYQGHVFKLKNKEEYYIYF